MSEDIEIYKSEVYLTWQAFDNNLEESQKLCDSLKLRYPEKVTPYIIQANIFFEQKLYEKAIEQFSLALEKDINKNAGGDINYAIGKLYGDWNNPSYNDKLATQYFAKSITYDSYPADAVHRLKYKLSNELERIKLFSDAITKFPDDVTFYILLARLYAECNDQPKAIDVLKNAITERQFRSISAYYNLGQFYLKILDYPSSREAFTEALILNKEKGGQNGFAINYSIGDTYFFENDFVNANKYYKESFIETRNNENCWVGFLGAVCVFEKTNDPALITELISKFIIDKSIFSETELFAGRYPIWFDSNDPEGIIEDLDVKNIYTSLKSIKSSLKDESLGRYWLIVAMFAKHLNKNSEWLAALRNSIKYISIYKHDFVLSEMAGAYSYILDNKCEKNQNADSVIKKLVVDLGNLPISFGKHVIDNSVMGILYRLKKYNEIVEICPLLSVTVLINSDFMFELAYSYNEIGNQIKAKELYQQYLKKNGESSAALNNLANIIKKEGDLEGALEMYKRAIELDSEDTIATNNLKNTKQQLEAKNIQEQEKKRQDVQFSNAVAMLSKENDFVLEKLSSFIENAKKDKDFKNWVLPIPQFKFAALMMTDKQKSQSLKEQWVTKDYIKEKGRDQYNAIIYQINPYLEQALTKIQRNRLPDKWISGFSIITIEKLDSMGYFEITERISKINKKYRSLISRDYDELIFNYLVSNEKSTIVIAGSLVELTLMYFLEKKKHLKISYKKPNGGNENKSLHDCVLNDLTMFIKENKLFAADFNHLSDLSRIYRNYVHPGKELKGILDKSKCDLCFISTTEILKSIL